MDQRTAALFFLFALVFSTMSAPIYEEADSNWWLVPWRPLAFSKPKCFYKDECLKIDGNEKCKKTFCCRFLRDTEKPTCDTSENESSSGSL
nr:uncharacterized protein LOC129274622 [Lytechinus pictus]